MRRYILESFQVFVQNAICLLYICKAYYDEGGWQPVNCALVGDTALRQTEKWLTIVVASLMSSVNFQCMNTIDSSLPSMLSSLSWLMRTFLVFLATFYHKWPETTYIPKETSSIPLVSKLILFNATNLYVPLPFSNLLLIFRNGVRRITHLILLRRSSQAIRERTWKFIPMTFPKLDAVMMFVLHDINMFFVRTLSFFIHLILNESLHPRAIVKNTDFTGSILIIHAVRNFRLFDLFKLEISAGQVIRIIFLKTGIFIF